MEKINEHTQDKLEKIDYEQYIHDLKEKESIDLEELKYYLETLEEMDVLLTYEHVTQ